MRLRLLFALVSVAVALPVGQSAAATASPFVHRSLKLPAVFAPPGFTGGDYTAAATGEVVRVFSAAAYSADATFNQRWADFLATLPHGQELSRVTVYLAPLAQVRSVCGQGTLACYSPDDEVIFTSGDDVGGRATAQSILAHEYGHHIANNETNSPWSAEDYGTKRWASYENICSRVRTGTIFPGDEGEHYRLNSGEWFAETYRVYVEQKLGLPATPWEAVDASLYPDAKALALLQQDLEAPWTGPTTSSYSSAFKPYTGGARTFGVSTPLDGVLTLKLRAPAGGSYDVRLYDAGGGKLLARTTAGARPVKTVRYAVCGERSLEVRVVRSKGFGAFTLQISKP